jgi:hypothetical protein
MLLLLLFFSAAAFAAVTVYVKPMLSRLKPGSPQFIFICAAKRANINFRHLSAAFADHMVVMPYLVQFKMTYPAAEDKLVHYVQAA